ncbi:hypothetical protein M3N64_04000 [Sporolactobacillus sp. CPB3-1]|uniref:Spore coat protein YutH n=1 Tax=Sporolactobacillus mangiferae TaxID=2940498 RepID=A0ABT0M8B8_9BACL|nr:hypothetical protein [Sporolactobacillus mangiferae]MCL1631109.1 hypothetical protein [Sporolactobacillus mangiferae]
MRTDWQSVAAHYYDLEDRDLGTSFFFHPLNGFYHHNLEGLAQWADYLSESSHLPVCQPIRNHEGRFDTELNGASWVLMRIPNEVRTDAPSTAATRLAEMHLQTSGIDPHAFPETPAASRIEDFEKRLAALEKSYDTCQKQSEQSRFEKIFIDSFPYFLGCAENAIQMQVDASIDFPDPDPLSIGHYRFIDYAPDTPENPALWVVDDRSRDVAEWLRNIAWSNASRDLQAQAEAFLDDYEARFPLSESVVRKMYGRLLFPLSYMECCERYFYQAESMETQRLDLILLKNEEKAEDYEQLLRLLSERYEGNLYAPEWLKK